MAPLQNKEDWLLSFYALTSRANQEQINSIGGGLWQCSAVGLQGAPGGSPFEIFCLGEVFHHSNVLVFTVGQGCY